ncbi:hypothetical protein Q6335_27820, partial [Klebsiella pneumoniae]|uniref:hypothetical protein n=1 Tax=Klebsiella pneumoniae TaxID=573 RepID=UPI0027314CCC
MLFGDMAPGGKKFRVGVPAQVPWRLLGHEVDQCPVDSGPCEGVDTVGVQNFPGVVDDGHRQTLIADIHLSCRVV